MGPSREQVIKEFFITSRKSVPPFKTPKESGDYGEAACERWMDGLELEYERFNDPKNRSGWEPLWATGAKIPDYLAHKRGEEMNYFYDSKYTITNGMKTFAMKETEIEQYRKLADGLASIYGSDPFCLKFLIVPSERKGAELIEVDFEDLVAAPLQKINGIDSRSVSLIDRPVLDIPLPEKW